MNNTRKRPILAALLALGSLATPALAPALSFVMPTDDALLAQADVVATARVAAVAPGDEANTSTRYALVTDRVLKGRIDKAVVDLVLPGGDPTAPSGFMVPGLPRLQGEERVLVFAARRDDGTLAPLHLSLGLFIEAWSRGQRYYVRSIDSHGDISDGANRGYYLPRAADRFESWIAERIAGGAGKTRYLAVDSGAQGAKFTLIRSSNTPVRWFEFDSGGSVTWTARSDGQAGMNTDEFQQFQDALAAWNNDAGSRINLVYGGTAAPIDAFCSGASDGNRVLWNDPQAQIGGSFSCSTGGVLAVAGPCFGGPPQNSNGTQFLRILEAQMIVQDGAGCFFDGAGGLNGAEVLAHELGHTLGLGHSCGDAQSPTCVPGSDFDNALMRATARGNRGAVLDVDDRAAVAFVYPAPGGGGVAPTITAPASFSAQEDTTLTLSGVSFADPDAGGTSLTATFSIAAGNGAINAAAASGVTIGGSATARTLAGTLGALNSALSAGSVTFQPAANASGNVSLTIGLVDGGTPQGSDSEVRPIAIAAINDAPTLSLPATIAATEDQSASIAPLTIADIDAGGASVVATFGVPAGTLSASSTGLVAVGGTATSRTLSGSIADLNDFLAAGLLTYTGAPNANGSVALSVAVNDQGNSGGGGAQTGSGSITLQIAPANDAPTASAPASLSVLAGAAVAVTPVSYADLDAPAGNINVVATYSAPSGSFSATAGGGVTVAGGGTGTLTLSGQLSAINSFLAATPVQYTAAAGASGIVPLTLAINDQGNTGGPAQSGNATVNVQVIAAGTIFVNGFEP